MTTPANLWDRPYTEDGDTILMEIPHGKDEWIWALETWKNGLQIEKGSDRYAIAMVTAVHKEGGEFGRITFRRLTVLCDIEMIPGPAIRISARGRFDTNQT